MSDKKTGKRMLSVPLKKRKRAYSKLTADCDCSALVQQLERRFEEAQSELKDVVREIAETQDAILILQGQLEEIMEDEDSAEESFTLISESPLEESSEEKTDIAARTRLAKSQDKAALLASPRILRRQDATYNGNDF